MVIPVPSTLDGDLHPPIRGHQLVLYFTNRITKNLAQQCAKWEVKLNLVNNNTITQYILILTNVFALNDQIFFFRVSSTHVECFQFWKEFMWSEIYLVQVQIWRFGANGSPAAACGWSLVVGGNIEATILNLDIISFLQCLYITCFTFQIFKY